MMEAIKKAASSWVVKVLIIAPLVLAFAIWGIEDMLRGPGAGDVASVGNRNIPAERFQTNYNLQLNLIAQQYRRRLTPDQANALGLPDEVLSRMINASAIEQHAEQLGLALSDEALARDIQRDPLFHDENGNFSRGQFSGLLYQSGLSENEYVSERRATTLRDQLTTAMTDSVQVPAALIDLTHAYQNAQRRLSFISVARAKPEEIAAPDDADLKAFYDARNTQFRTPEYRKVSLLQIRAADIRKAMTIPDDEIRQLYDSQKANFETPERRQIEQIAFPDAETAAAAAKEIADGKDFLEVAKASGAQEADIKLGLLTKAEMIDQTIADAAFALEKDQVSEPVAGQFTTVLLRVTEIRPREVREFDEVKDEVRDQLVNQRISTEIQRIHDLVDEKKLAGGTPEEVAKELNIAFEIVEATDRNGAGPGNVPMIVGPDAGNILSTVFEGLIGVENEVIERTDGGYAWVDVLEITEAKQRAFEEAKDDVLTAWRETQADDRLRETAEAYSERLRKGETLEAVASEAGLEVTTTEPFKRTDQPEGLPRSAVTQAFSLGAGGVANTPTGDRSARVVFRVAEVLPAGPLDEAGRMALDEQLRRSRQADVLAEYVRRLQTELQVTINRPTVNRLLGIGAS